MSHGYWESESELGTQSVCLQGPSSLAGRITRCLPTVTTTKANLISCSLCVGYSSEYFRYTNPCNDSMIHVTVKEIATGKWGKFPEITQAESSRADPEFRGVTPQPFLCLWHCLFLKLLLFLLENFEDKSCLLLQLCSWNMSWILFILTSSRSEE